MLSLNFDGNIFCLDVCLNGIKCLNWMRRDMKTAEIINVAAVARWRRPRFVFRLRPQGRGTPEHRENHRLLPESQRPAGVAAVMGKPPGTGPSGPGRITEEKEKGDFVQSKYIILPPPYCGGGRFLLFAFWAPLWQTLPIWCACGQREKRLFRKWFLWLSYQSVKVIWCREDVIEAGVQRSQLCFSCV